MACVPRPHRMFTPNGIYHVFARGSNREALYSADGDHIAFEERLGGVVRAYELRCAAWVQMTNHYHAILQTPDARLSDALRDLHGGYSRLYCRAHGRDAHVFKNRFRAVEIETEAQFLTAMRYLHLNPCRAGLCDSPEAWLWSSYPATIGNVREPAFLSLELLLGILGPEPSEAQARYRRFVEAGASELRHVRTLASSLA